MKIGDAQWNASRILHACIGDSLQKAQSPSITGFDGSAASLTELMEARSYTEMLLTGIEGLLTVAKEEAP